MNFALLALLVGVAAAATVPQFEIPAEPAEGATEPESCTAEIKAVRAKMVEEADKLADAYETAEIAVQGLNVKKFLTQDEFYVAKQGKTAAEIKEITAVFKPKIAALDAKREPAKTARNKARNALVAFATKVNRLYPQYIKACPVESCTTGRDAIKFANEKLTKLQHYIDEFKAGAKAAEAAGRSKARAQAIFLHLRNYYQNQLTPFVAEARKLAKQVDGACNTASFTSFLEEWIAEAEKALGETK